MNKLTKLTSWLRHPRYRLLKVGIIGLSAVAIFYITSQTLRSLTDPRSQPFIQWATGDNENRDELVTIRQEACDGAPFILPADGFIGLLYEDPRGPYSTRNPHQGLDIFSNTEAGITPVYAAYDGY
ncbi:MAG: hypothetical protein GY943_38300, partial [Chloroflexi bacterium]|nr:hypothetical protein [Chloroflexota bacterium]